MPSAFMIHRIRQQLALARRRRLFASHVVRVGVLRALTFRAGRAMNTAHRHAHCLDCGYCLFGLSDQCPECGRPFDPADMFSYAPSPVRREWTDFAMMAILIVFAFAIVAAVLA